MPNLDQIIAELVALDPALKARETELRAAVAKLLDAKPDTKFDQEFAKALHTELLGMTSAESQPKPLFNFFNFFTMSKLIPSVAVVTLAALVIIPLWQGHEQIEIHNEPVAQSLDGSSEVAESTVAADPSTATIAEGDSETLESFATEPANDDTNLAEISEPPASEPPTEAGMKISRAAEDASTDLSLTADHKSIVSNGRTLLTIGDPCDYWLL